MIDLVHITNRTSISPPSISLGQSDHPSISPPSILPGQSDHQSISPRQTTEASLSSSPNNAPGPSIILKPEDDQYSTSF